MDLKECETLDINLQQHWYYRSKAQAMLRLLGPVKAGAILDVGAGSGFFSSYLLARSDATEAWCVDICYPRDSDASESGKPIHFRTALETVNARTVLLMDVLEHVDDDVGLLRAQVQKVPSGSRFLITVPAFQFLWSGHDVFLEHKRRYTLEQLESVMRDAGLQVRHGAYYFGFVFPLAAALRLLPKLLWWRREEAKSQLTAPHPVSNALLAAACKIELPLMKFNRLAGLSVICLAEKP